MQKAWKEGRIPKHKGYNYKLTKEEAYAIKYELNHLKNIEVSKMFKNANPMTVSLIRRGKSWKQI